jgi:hypothetical protein
MIGDFTGNKRTSHFESEESFESLFYMFLSSCIFDLFCNSRFIFKRPKSYTFSVNNKDYQIILPPIITRESKTKIKKKIDGKNKKIEKSELVANEKSTEYYKRNEVFFIEQYKTILNTINGDNEKHTSFVTDIFAGKKLRYLSNDFQTIFTDIEAILLCEKLSTPFIRKLLLDKINNIKYLHQIAMKCFNKYGGSIISFLLNLPIIDFGRQTSKILNEEKDYDGTIPALRLKFYKNGDEYIISFKENKPKGSKEKYGYVFNKTKNITEGYITFLDYIENKMAKENLKIRLFIDEIHNRTPIIYCGVNYGHCINCKKELNDPISLKVGYGKECSKTLGIDYY